ncbi:MAG: glyoxalase [Bacteroidetes bacterium]|nr:glyoxalase [Bacteroidota bacterium]
MENRNKIRPILPTEIVNGINSPAEAFQNSVLRPIIKMQSDLLMAHISAQLKTLKIDWIAFTPLKRKEALTSLLTKDQLFKSEIVGMVIGQLEVKEYTTYRANHKELGKRITQMVLNRAIDLLGSTTRFEDFIRM